MKNYLLFKVIIFIGGSLAFISSCNNSKSDLADFNVFIEKFKKDSTFQSQHISFPVMENYSDEDFPLDILQRTIYKDNYTFIDIENDVPKELRNKDLYDVHINQIQDTVYYQKFGKNNSINITYKFQRIQNTYRLIEIEDLTN
ncbi:hypothetical protein [Chryseobacterium luquanense]|uniref:DUF4348 domain-containing protein n=1 Tax=Chryseobacterium luquanense TaxID=2983766 RepID=A0ABT3Y4U0_9FLAO|nr:hypothetical protein [Chryseobacterium luquanense]MCX8533170.1 hypothetical protein [Chryseobacterium luquanense]